jgi:hypothetical protein
MKKNFTDELKIENPFLKTNKKEQPKKKKTLKSFTLDHDLAEELKDKVYDFRMNQSEIVNKALRELFENYNKKK